MGGGRKVGDHMGGLWEKASGGGSHAGHVIVKPPIVVSGKFSLRSLLYFCNCVYFQKKEKKNNNNSYTFS